MASSDKLTQVEEDTKLAASVRDADIVILLKANPDGIGAAVWFKGMSVKGGSVPWDADVAFGEKDDPPGTIRQVNVKAGWNLRDWRKLNRSGLHKDVQTDDNSPGCTKQEASHA